MRKHKYTNRFTSIWIVLFTIGFLIIAGRFLYIQITGNVQNVSLIEWAENVRKTSVTLESERGAIMDSSGNLLAFNRPVYKMYAILSEDFSANSSKPLHVKDFEKTANELSAVIDMDASEILKRLEKGKASDAFQIEFGKDGKDLSEKEKDEIQALELPGINFMKESKRYYPNNNFASHIIGFVNESEDEKTVQGITGIEQMFNKYLIGEDGYINYQRDRYNKKLLQKDVHMKEAENGFDVFLTIDQKIQSLLEDILDQMVEKYEPERMTTVVMNAKTGEILALANRPSVNLNQIGEVQNWYNDAISTPVEPGSTMKIFTWAAAIDAGIYDAEETYLSGKYKIHEIENAVNDHNYGKGWGYITYDEGFYRSSNVAASKLVWEKLDEATYLDYLDAFDLFEKTNIELPNEKVGQLTFNYPSDKIRTAFGQSSTVTPLQQMKAATAIANKGEMVQPIIVKKIVDPATGETVKEAQRTVVGKPITEETSEKMLDLMTGVVEEEGGTGRKFQLDSYTTLGKTGTAQMPNMVTGGYKDGGVMHSFLGMAPSEDPEIMVYVSVQNPELKESEFGNDVVSTIYTNIMENSLHYLHVQPDNDQLKEAKKVSIPTITGKTKEEAEFLLKDFEKVVFVGKGKKVVKVNYEDTTVYNSQKMIVLLEEPTIPDFIGWSQRDVHHFAEMANISIKTNGEGFVKKQSVKKGSVLEEGMTIELELEANKKKKKKKK